MTDTLCFPGNHPATEPWLRDLVGSLSLPDLASRVLRYAHWDGSRGPDVDREAGQVRGLRPELAIAKSLGTELLSYAHEHHEFRPSRAVLIGTPVARFDAGQLERLRRLLAAVPVLLIQQTKDVAGSCALLRESLVLPETCRLEEVPGSDHVYASGVVNPLIEAWYRGS